MEESTGFQAELEALGVVFAALEPLSEESRAFVLKTAAERLGVGAPRPSVRQPPDTLIPLGPVNADESTVELLSPRDFMREKDPGTDVQRVACLALFLTEHRGQAHFKSRDLVDLNREAALQPINMSRAVANATAQSGYLAVAGRGNKQLSPLGEDVARALPDREAARALEAEKRRKKKKRTARKKQAAKGSE